jgi:coenzyme Q-binding protein COQ10
VAGVERYPEFLPWCVASRVKSRDGNTLIADLVIGFKMIRERYTSRIVLERPHRIDVTYLEGPLKHLTNHWSFQPNPGGGTLVDFYVDFEFRSRLLQTLIGALFHEALRRLVRAFEDRAKKLYG